MRSGSRRVVSADDYLVVVSMALTLGGLILAAVFGAASVIGVTALVVLALLLGGSLIIRGARLVWLLPFGFVAGVLELWADWVHVTALHSLTYTEYFGLRLLASPTYMPLGWWITVVQFGYLALRLRDLWSATRVVMVLVVLGLVVPPWYEELAARAHAWHYTSRGPFLGHTPLWVIGTYACCMFVIATLALLLYRPGAWNRAFLGGLYAGAGITLSSIVCYSLAVGV